MLPNRLQYSYRPRFKSLPVWLSNFSYKSKWLIVVGLLMIVSSTNLPQLFADQVVQYAHVVQKNTKIQRIVSLDQLPAARTSYKSLKTKKAAKQPKSQPITPDMCIWDMAHMQWTGLQTYTGEYLSG